MGSPSRRSRAAPSRARALGWAAASIVVAGLAIAGFLAALHHLEPRIGKRRATAEWNIVSVAADRRSAVIRVEVCGERYDGADVQRVGNDIRLTVFRQKETVGNPALQDCEPFSMMPTHVVRFPFRLPLAGHVLSSNCPASVCDQTPGGLIAP